MTIDDIIAAAVSHLRSLPDGTEISTSEALAAACGFNFDPEGECLVGDVQIDFKGMFELDQDIRKAARKAGLALDDSAYADMVLGLPFNIPYIVKKRRGKHT